MPHQGSRGSLARRDEGSGGEKRGGISFGLKWGRIELCALKNNDTENPKHFLLCCISIDHIIAKFGILKINGNTFFRIARDT